ncbi:asparaginase [Candidatus Enterococcus ferrettii]|uniref:asparaginase n=1 Tax=Candidatus Enterococcus ferrettii TaxID=2815324 RepID=A0ABV0EHZ3_9ENTE|nr:asparaginase [Enterococcus sp. 665A]MBO1338529.1 asparaginase [Enterococcus sp. 665A]
MKRILILHTGGTISMSEDEHGAVRPDEKNPLLAAGQKLDIPKDVELVVEDFSNLPSPHITVEIMFDLKERIKKAVNEEIDCVVITHGTDTLEETAYFLDVTIGNLMPIVLTGAMRSINELGSDGLYNFQSAIRVASCEDAVNQGVLVVMNDEIHSARYVTKTHTTNVATFRTPTLGPVGLVTKSKILFMQELPTATRYDVASIDAMIPIIKAFAGMQGTFFELLDHAMGVDGVVVEALGAGNLPPATLPSLQNLLNKDMPIVLVSRCFNGIAEPVYDYRGGGIELAEKGVIFCRGINSQKARIKLLIAMNANLSQEQLKQFMEE